MTLPTTLTQAYRQQRLLALWAALPFALPALPPAKRVVALNRWSADAADRTPPAEPDVLPHLPPLPILSLDPTGRVEETFSRAGVTLQVVAGRRDAPARDRHVLLKLAGDLGSRTGVILSQAELRELNSDPDKRYLLSEARRGVDGGALLLPGCDPASTDFRAWWAILAPARGRPAVFPVGEPAAAAWPASPEQSDLCCQLSASSYKLSSHSPQYARAFCRCSS